MNLEKVDLILIFAFFAIALVVGIFLNSIGRNIELVLLMTVAGSSIIAIYKHRQKKLRASAH